MWEGWAPAVNASQRRLGQNPAPSQSQMHRRKASQQSAHSDGPHPPRQATSGLLPCARRARPRPGFAPALGAPRQYHAAAGAGEDYRGWCAGSASRKIRGRGAWNGAPHTATSCSAAHRPPGGEGGSGTRVASCATTAAAFQPCAHTFFSKSPFFSQVCRPATAVPPRTCPPPPTKTALPLGPRRRSLLERSAARRFSLPPCYQTRPAA
eukprot:scaffold3946_cov118-Isochrysis_galbana.AAC.6